jgi:hypothetical protein
MHWEFQIIQEYAPKGKIVALILLIGVTLASIVLEVLLVSDIKAAQPTCPLSVHEYPSLLDTTYDRGSGEMTIGQRSGNVEVDSLPLGPAIVARSRPTINKLTSKVRQRL